MTTAINRVSLLKLVSLVKPALASQAYIPALTHIRFDGVTITAFNDVTAISVQSDLDVKACIPGDLLAKTLSSFGADSINFQEHDKEQAVVLSSGRAKLKLPVLAVTDFPFDMPSIKTADEIVLDAKIMEGIERCLLNVGTNPKHPAQMGVTLDCDDKGNAILFSTDNFTVSRYQTDSKIKLPGEFPVILPTFFCQQLVSLGRVFGEEEIVLCLLPGILVADFGDKAQLFNKVLIDLEPLDFPRIFKKHCDISKLKEVLGAIPDNWESAFERAMLVLGGEANKVTKVTVNASGIKLSSTSTMGDSDDSMEGSSDQHPTGAPNEPFYVDPSLILRASKGCSQMAWNAMSLVLADAETNFAHLIAYTTK